MKKWLAISVIAILVIGIIVTACLLVRESGKLGEAESKIATLQDEVATLQESNSTLQTKLADSENKTVALQANLDVANTRIGALNDTITSLRGTISTQADELKKIKYPRHFASLTELTNWLQKDDTNLKYSGITQQQLGYILQVKALQDGYLLPVRTPVVAVGFTELDTNFAIIGDVVYTVQASNDSVARWALAAPLPSYPIPPP